MHSIDIMKVKLIKIMLNLNDLVLYYYSGTFFQLAFFGSIYCQVNVHDIV